MNDHARDYVYSYDREEGTLCRARRLLEENLLCTSRTGGFLLHLSIYRHHAKANTLAHAAEE